MRMSATFMFLGVAAVLLAVPAGAAPAKGGPVYTHLVFQTFDTSAAPDFPADFVMSLRQNIVRHLQDTGRFRSVTLIEPGEATPTDADLVLTGKIVRFKKGSRAARYMVPGVGATSIRAWIEFTDPSGKSVLKREVSGKVVIGVFGG